MNLGRLRQVIIKQKQIIQVCHYIIKVMGKPLLAKKNATFHITNEKKNDNYRFVYQPKLGYQQTFIQPPQLPPKISYQPSLPPKMPLDRPRDIRAPELPPKIKLDNNESVHRSGVTTDGKEWYIRERSISYIFICSFDGKRRTT